jgi:CheY-like chemotaxis protein
MANRRNFVVLVVEDEPYLRLDTVDLVEEAGFSTVEAANADEAIKILEHRNDIRVVLTDVGLPGSMDGVKLALAIRDRWPPIGLIITSGQLNLNLDDLPLRSRFFAKPYDPMKLVQALTTFAE